MLRLVAFKTTMAASVVDNLLLGQAPLRAGNGRTGHACRRARRLRLEQDGPGTKEERSRLCPLLRLYDVEDTVYDEQVTNETRT